MRTLKSKFQFIAGVMAFFAAVLVHADNMLSASENYTLFCGQRSEVIAYSKSLPKPLEKKDLKEIALSRYAILNLLANGAQSVKPLLTMSTSKDVATMAIYFSCQIMLQLEFQIREKGCCDLVNDMRVDDNNGIKTCKAILKMKPDVEI